MLRVMRKVHASISMQEEGERAEGGGEIDQRVQRKGKM